MMRGSGGSESSRGADVDLGNCAREPIHIPGSIQPHGVLLVLGEPELRILQVSENSEELLGAPAAAALGRSLIELWGDRVAPLAADLKAAPVQGRPVFLRTLDLGAIGPGGRARSFHAVAHRNHGVILLELELAEEGAADALRDVHALFDAFTLRAESAAALQDLCRLAAQEVRRLTGFDRVLIYKFDEHWNGLVVGEDGTGQLPSLLYHRFPASDIPAQARELYRVNRVRIIPDAGYRSVPITPAQNPVTGRPLDMSFSTLRSVSPVHVEYMRNMETAASMSVSILRDGRLWGLISCHNKEPRTVPFQVRAVCDLFGRAFSLRLSAIEHSHDLERRVEVQAAYSRLVAMMADGADFAASLFDHGPSLVSFVNAQGAAILTEGRCLLLGDTPEEAQVRELAQWLFRSVKEEVYGTDSLPGAYPEAEAYKDKACGLLAVAVSKLYPRYVLWFRPEVIQTLKWGGNPHKPVETKGDRLILHPRRSFETWLETVRNRSMPWKPSEVEGAAELRNTIVGSVLRKAEETAALNAELLRSNKELESFSYSVSHDLRAPLRHIASYAAILKDTEGGSLSERSARYLATIIDSSDYAGRLVDKLLGFSRLGRSEMQRVRVDMNVLLREVQAEVMKDARDRKITWKVGQLPTVRVDLMMLRMAVRDLLANAVKYTREKDEAVIEVECREEGSEYVFFVRDNGIGFDMTYVDKLFGVFQRLHRWEDYEGTGIGLANVRRVMERHNGRTWAEGEEGKGATFYFSLPKPQGDQ
jgi:light-regulated signal transduction histidine kinase (bacteriophytochrome)